jgi:hypothetical protein
LGSFMLNHDAKYNSLTLMDVVFGSVLVKYIIALV